MSSNKGDGRGSSVNTCSEDGDLAGWSGCARTNHLDGSNGSHRTKSNVDMPGVSVIIVGDVEVGVRSRLLTNSTCLFRLREMKPTLHAVGLYQSCYGHTKSGSFVD
jgi:hypothetical protein